QGRSRGTAPPLFMIVAPVLLALSWVGLRGPGGEPNGRRFTSVERMRRERLRAVHEDRMRFAQERKAVSFDAGYRDFRGILHAHAEDSAHTRGTRPDLPAAAPGARGRVVARTHHVPRGGGFSSASAGSGVA